MTEKSLIDDHVSAKQCKLAVEALLKHETKRQQKLEESELLPGKEPSVWLSVTVKQMHPEKKLKPYKIPLSHPVVDPRTSPVCLITKDPQREYKDLLEEHKIRFISRVVGITKLKGKFKPFEARRLLLKENGLFLADERVVPLLPGLLGKKFFDAKKQPIPVNLTRKDLKGELERAISSTYFHQNQGTCSSVKIGTLSQSSSHVLDNLKTALPAIVKTIKGGWDNLQSLHIKTSTSASLPIWSCDLSSESGGRWDGIADVEMDGSDAESAEKGAGSDAESEAEVVVQKPSKGKKRAAEAVEEPPKKKAKASIPIPEPTKSSKTSASKKTTAAAPPPTTESGGKPKKRKSADAAPSKIVAEESVAAGVASELAASKTSNDSQKKRKGKASAAEPAPSSSAAPAPVTPSVSKPKTRARATDFFNDAEAAPAPPPNTPADGLKASGKAKKGKKAVDQTPVSAAISKLTEDVAASPDLESPTEAKLAKVKKPRHKKSKAAAAAAAEVPEEAPKDDGAGADAKKASKKKEKTTEAVAAPVPVPSQTADVSMEDLKRKRGASGLEKKKEKTLKAKRTAKEELIGKKGL